MFGVIVRMSSQGFFVEGSILAQDERWRLRRGESGERVSNA